MGKIESKKDGGGYTAGIIGYGWNTKVTKCYNKGTIISKGYYIGGITGYEGAVSYSCNFAEIYGDSYIGGIVGYTCYEINDVYNRGNIIQSGSNKNCVGGIVGYSSSKGIKNAYNTGIISTSDNVDKVGGIVGQSYEYLNNTYNLGKVETNGQYIGSIAGNTSEENTDNYYLKGTFEKGIGRVADDKTDNSEEKETEQEMKEIMNANLASLEGWSEDLNNDNDGYPILEF